MGPPSPDEYVKKLGWGIIRDHVVAPPTGPTCFKRVREKGDTPDIRFDAVGSVAEVGSSLGDATMRTSRHARYRVEKAAA